MKKPQTILAGVVSILGLIFILHAQEVTPPDSIVQVTAEAQGLSLVSPTDLPEAGTFWLVMTNAICPEPVPMFSPTFPVYQIADDEYLVDGTEGQVAVDPDQLATMGMSDAVNAALEAQATNILNVINLVQGAQASRAMVSRRGMSMMLSSEDDSGSFSPMFASFDTNTLYLQMLGVTNGTAHLTLNNATNQVYEILSKTDLTPTNWTIEQEVWPTNTAVMPFTLLEQGRTNLFVWARDWTGVTENGNTTPDWWFWKYFGTTALLDTNLDCAGNTLVYDYTNGINPNPLTANALSVATCKNTSAAVTLSGYDYCGDDPSTFLAAVLTAPTNGHLTGVPPNLTYTPASPTFTGMDSFTYQVGNAWGGDAATNTATITVGDADVTANSQWPMTGTNQPLSFSLTASSSLGCTNSLNYTLLTSPAHGTLTGTGTNRTYAPSLNYEGVDSFDFTASDGVWTNSPATVTIFVVAGPTNLTAQCRFDQIVLSWGLDDAVQVMETEGLNPQDFRVYRATTHGGPYTLIDTTLNRNITNYVDMAVATNTTYYYVTTFQYQDPYTGINYESPYSGEAAISPCTLPSPLRPGFNQNILGPNDDDSYGDNGFDSGPIVTNLLATIGFPVKFFGTTYSNLYVNNNGNVTFGDFLPTYTPTPLVDVVTDPTATATNIIAPYWADVDTWGALSALVTYGTNSVTVTNSGVIHTNAAFAANWFDVGYYQANDDKLNAFQLVLINRPDRASGDYDVEFNYAQIQWEAGDASGGSDGLWTGQPTGDYGFSARAGFASATGLSFELNGSAIPRAFLDTNLVTGLIHTNYNSSGVLGRYVYEFHNGTNNLAHP